MEERGFRVRQFLIRPSLSQIEGPGGQIHVNPKAMEVLVALASRPGEVLSKDRLLEDVWPGTFVTEAVLTSAIWELRKAFDDDARRPEFIQTIPKRGYRLLPPVEPWGAAAGPLGPAVAEAVAGPPAAAIPAAHEPAGAALRFLALALGLVAFAALGVWLRDSDLRLAAPDSGKITIAILPFDNNTGDPQLDWLRHGIPDMLALDLSRSAYLRVVSLETVTGILGDLARSEPAVRGGDLVRAIQRRSGARVVVTGRTLRDPSRFLILAQLHDFASGEQRAEEAQADGPEAVLDLADEIAGKVRLALEIEASDLPGIEEGLRRTRTDSVEAYKHYLDGRGRLQKLEVREAVTDLQRAVAIDSGFAHAYEALADAYDLMGESRLSREAIDKAVTASGELPRVEQLLMLQHRAQLDADVTGELGYLKELVALEPEEPLWQFRLAGFYQTHLRDCDRSLPLYRRAIELDRGGHPQFYADLADADFACSNPAAAVDAVQRYAALLPGEATTHLQFGRAFLRIGSYERAAEELDAALARRPGFTFALSGLGDVFRAEGRFAAAEDAYESYLAQALGPNDEAAALERLARLHLEAGEPAAAAEFAGRALAVDERSAVGLWLLGLARLQLGDLAAARSTADSLAGILARNDSRRDEEYLYHLRAMILLASGQADQAVEALAAALDVHPLEQDFFRDALAAAKLGAADLTGAGAAYRAVFEINPRYARARCGYGEVLERLGEPEAAAGEYAKCKEIWKGNGTPPPWLQRARQRLAALEVSN